MLHHERVYLLQIKNTSWHKKIWCAHDEAVHILYRLLPLSILVKQLPPYTIDCRTQIAIISWNMFKAASLSYYLIVTMKILELL